MESDFASALDDGCEQFIPEIAIESVVHTASAIQGPPCAGAVRARSLLYIFFGSPRPFLPARPQGTRVSDGGEALFATDEFTEIAIGDTQAVIPCTYQIAGIIGNEILAGAINTLLDPIQIPALSAQLRLRGLSAAS